MKSAWNLVGILIWLIVILFFVWMVHDMRSRRIKLIVTEHKTFSAKELIISIIELVVFIVGFGLMSKVTFFQNVNSISDNRVTDSYSYQPLIIKSGREHSYYVKVKNAGDNKPIQEYTYWVEGELYKVNSYEATIVAGKSNLNLAASGYNWDRKKLDLFDQRYQRAWVGTAKMTYKKNFVNGIGLHAGRQANRFNLIRVPDHSFVDLDK